MKVSVILPTYNESGNIIALVHAILKVMPSSVEPEILIVDDDSPDGTYQLTLDHFRHDIRIIPILRKSDRGLAKSIRAGIERSTGEQVIVMDTDFSHDPAEIPRLLHIVEICAGGGMQDTAHYLASLAYNWMLRIILRTQVQDNLCGFFVASRSLLNQLPSDRIYYGYGDYFFRLVYFFQQRGGKLVEIPVQYCARTAGVSKSSFLKMVVGYSLAAIRLKLVPSSPGRPEK
jgi:dolichol-phosphate mannosyltransferase